MDDSVFWRYIINIILKIIFFKPIPVILAFPLFFFFLFWLSFFFVVRNEYYTHFNGESLDLYLKSVFKKIMFIKKMKFWTFVRTSYNWSKYNMENTTFFLILPRYNSIRIQWFQNWYSKCNSKATCLASEMVKQIKNLFLLMLLQ